MNNRGTSPLSYIWLFLLLALSLPARAIPAELLVFYPDVREPYAKIYSDIIGGIRNNNQDSTTAVAITDTKDIDNYKATVASSKPDKIIALGADAIDIASRLAPDIPVVAGAVSAASPGVTGVSMIADPAIVIAKLQLLDSNVSSIHVITDSSNKQIQLRAAIEYASSVNINFVVHEADTIKAAANEYRNLLGKLSEHDAIWLMRDKALNDTSLLSSVLEAAWDNKIIVFSSNPAHVKRGALFSVYPNNAALGATLADFAHTGDSSSEEKLQLQFLRDIYIAGNGRTLRHLGLTQSNETHRVLDNIL